MKPVRSEYILKLDLLVMEQLRRLAVMHQMSRTDFINQILEDFVRENPPPPWERIERQKDITL